MDTYEKKYKEALERAREALNDGTISSNTIAYLQDIFPELKESEDERIRKALLEMVHDTAGDELWVDYNVHKEDCLAWLEKQEGCEYIKKDWLEHIKQSWYKEGFIDGKYTPKELTINDVATLNELIDFLENGTAKLQHDLTLYANWLKTQFPTNEKQGEQKPQRMISAEAKEALYDKLDWGKEDESYLNTTIAYLKDAQEFKKTAENCITWLKSLKQRIGGEQ